MSIDPQPYIIAYLYFMGGVEAYQNLRDQVTEEDIDRIAPLLPNAMGWTKAILVIGAVLWPIISLWGLLSPKKSK